MEEKVLAKKDLEEIFTGFEKRQDGKFKALEERMDQKMTSLEVRVIDQFHIISEGLMDQITLLAEEHDGVIDRLTGIDKRFDHMEKENERQHLETRALVKLSFSELDRRLTDLESQMKQMQEWRKQVESRFQI